MPVDRPRRPVSERGVKILSSKQGDEGVKRLSKFEGQPDPETQAESRVVGHEEFGKTKKLIEDESMREKK